MGVAVPGTACPGFEVSVATVSVDGAVVVVVEEDKTLVSVLTVVIGTGVDLRKKYSQTSVD